MKHIIKPKIQKELFNYRGKWVALTRKRIIAVGDSSTGVYEEAQRQGIKIPVLYKVPEKDTQYFY